MTRFASICALAILFAAGAASRADEPVEKDLRGERIRQGVLNYLNEIRDKKGELQGTEKEVKQILATDARIKDLKAAKIKIDGDKITVDIWHIDAKTGDLSILLFNQNQTAFINFKGSATAKANSPPQVTINGITYGHAK